MNTRQRDVTPAGRLNSRGRAMKQMQGNEADKEATTKPRAFVEGAGPAGD